MSWKKKNGVYRFEGKYSSAKIQSVEGRSESFNMRVFTKKDSQWRDGYIGTLDACKQIAEKFISDWDKKIDRYEEAVKCRQKYWHDFESLSPLEKKIVTHMREITRMDNDQREAEISHLPEQLKALAISFCEAYDNDIKEVENKKGEQK
jgi:hypothetical protein